jgi:hypothetical protein
MFEQMNILFILRGIVYIEFVFYVCDVTWTTDISYIHGGVNHGDLRDRNEG